MRSLVAIIFIVLLAGCQSTINPNAKSIPICKEMRAKMVFNGSAVNPQRYFLDNADQPKLKQSYHDENCI